MNEVNRISKLFEDLYEGDPWIDITILGTVGNLTARQAATKVYPEYNTVWEILNHMISWRMNVLERVQGKVLKTPADNYFREITDQSDAAWTETLQRLSESQIKWRAFLETFQEEAFLKEYPVNHMTYYEHIHGILQHDAYHLGQLTILIKSIRLRESK
jgi:uncharacterized damage-inducible protein DinB